MIKIGIFEDHPIVLKSLNDLFLKHNGYEILFTAKTKEIFYGALEEKHADLDILIVDMLAQDVSGMEVFEYIQKKYSSANVIAFTTLSSPILVENLLRLGVKAYVNKNQELADLLSAIELVTNGSIYLPNDYSFLKKNYHGNKSNLLSERELKIIQLIAKEFTTKDIAEQLNISVNTVENHRKSIFHKMDVKNVAGMILEAVKMGHL
jgi:DNA-binding NarL/FixJ family response regulator